MARSGLRGLILLGGEVYTGNHTAIVVICSRLSLFIAVLTKADDRVDLVSHDDLQVAILLLHQTSLIVLCFRWSTSALYLPLLQFLIDIFAVFTDRI